MDPRKVSKKIVDTQEASKKIVDAREASKKKWTQKIAVHCFARNAKSLIVITLIPEICGENTGLEANIDIAFEGNSN